MSDEIKEILDYFRKYATIRENTMISEIEDCITNLQQAFENSYTEEQLDFAVNEVKEQLKAEHQLTNQLHNEIDKLRIKNYELQQENDDKDWKIDLLGKKLDDLTDSWISRGKKIEDLKQENERLKEKESLIESDINNAYSYLRDYKSRCEKAIEVINTQLKNAEGGYKDNLRIIKFNLIKGSCTFEDLKTEDDYKYDGGKDE